MESSEKIMAQVSYPWGSKAFPVEWNKLPEELIKKINRDDVYEELCCSDTGEPVLRSVIYFRIVKRFRTGVELIDTDKVIFGV